MKRVFTAIVLLLSISSFAQLAKPSTIPPELLTKDSTYWTISTISGVNYVNTTPGYKYGTVTSGGGMIVNFKFLPSNRYIFQLYVQSNMYSSRLESWTEIEGAVTFAKDASGQNIFSTKAEKGRYRMYRNGDVKVREVTADELKNQHSTTYLWEKTKLKDDPNNLYLLLVDLKKYPKANIKKPGTITADMVSKFHIPDRN
ncbi:MAG: hypothetical protein EOO10_01895 [Chitinophagaceae bacterium]|nr:MAG: hypothetical protein EOO10_01895 [Chitinophagaceae bacterium]